MSKTVIFVEGVTELVFVREFIDKWFCYDSSRYGFRCLALRSESSGMHDVDYMKRQTGGDENYYEIINVGCDERVLSKMIESAPRYINLGFSKIIGLRDMYSDNYKKVSRNFEISESVIARFRAMATDMIDERGYSSVMSLHFAIMEVEAWLLGMGWFLNRLDSRWSQDYLKENNLLDWTVDVEKHVFHPAVALKRIFQDGNKDYGKHELEINRIMGQVCRQDFERLLESGNCRSFAEFVGRVAAGTDR